MGKTILIVEDEKNIVDILSYNLNKEGYTTLEAYDGDAGLQLALEQDPDLILLDLMLPRKNGFDVCRDLRAQGRTTPIIMLTAREEETDKVLGLELGADDYITKPFSMRELLARVKANIRRSTMVPPAGAAAPSGRMELGRISIDTELLMAYKDNLPLDLNVHSLRHTAASLMISGGADVATVSGLLGHAQVSTTLDIYTHAFDEKKREVSAQMQGRVGV